MKKLITTTLLLTQIIFTSCAAHTATPVNKQKIISSNNKFAFDLYAQLKNEDGNLFFSPYSISTALAMTYAGARGDTADQMAQTMHYLQNQEEFHPAFGSIIDTLNEQGKKGDYQLSVANALWAQKDYNFLNPFLKLNKTHYNAGIENMDFANETEKSRVKINKWVEDKTNNKIENLIPKGALNPLTRLVLTNAIYFKGDWANQFDAEETTTQDFYITPNKTTKAELMYQKEDFNYAETDTLQILQLPYKGDDLSMLVLLPNTKEGLKELENQLGLKELENQLTVENLSKWQQQMHEEEVLVYLPKFKMTSEFSLNKTLKKMGMIDAFGRNADFSGMDGTKNLFISAVLHKAFVEVNEEGTEAAAATGVVMSLKAVLEETVFRADHPFIFIIKDNNTDSILFAGRITDPSKSE